jgi:hypothetical protein
MSWLFNGTINQRKTPAFYADVLASRPAAGYDGRIFIATDNPYGIYRDNGSTWVQIAGNGSVTGTGTAGTIVKFNSAGVIGNSIITESGTTINIAGVSVVRPLLTTDYQVTYLQQNAANSGWSLKADNSGNLSLVRLNAGVYAAIAFSWTSAGTITTNGNSITIGSTIATGTGVLYSKNNFFTALNYGTSGTPVNEEILGYSYNAFAKFALETSNAYNSNQSTGFRFKITDNSGNPIYPITASNGVGNITLSGTLGINGIADNVKSGTYTPTVSNIVGTSGLSASVCYYTRVDNIVTVSFEVIGTTTGGTNQFNMSIPIGGNFSANGQACGSGGVGGNVGYDIGLVYASSGTTNVIVTAINGLNTTFGIRGVFQYQIQ